MVKKSEQKNTLVPRQPVVAIMGHIDHGKTTLLDYIRQTAVAMKETGGITQRVAAYEVTRKASDGKESKITFIDTPGHEAFLAVRSRGAAVADIAVLIVSGEDGVKPQTLEALKFINDAKLPLIVVISKIDKPSADIERTKQNLLENGIYIEGYGGTIPCVALSGKTGEGVSDLLDMVLLVAEMENIYADFKKPAEGIVLESSRSKEKGVAATLIIKNGCLKKGMAIVSGATLSSLRHMENFAGKKIEVAESGMPVIVFGWDKMPSPGTGFVSFANKNEAEKYRSEQNEKTVQGKSFSANAPKEERTLVPLIIKADTLGSLDAILHELDKFKSDKIVPKIIQPGTGTINESDIKAALTSAASIVLGFNVQVDGPAKNLALRDGISIELFDIIYKLTERVAEILRKRTPKIKVAEMSGRAKIVRMFNAVKDRQILGGKVTEGIIRQGEIFKIIRRTAEVGEGKIKGLEQAKVKTSEVAEGHEFGAMVEAKIEIAPGDTIETFVIVEK